ncbi:hypothetical protein ACS0TY_022787 [Phlomoides rotata]
MCTEALSVLIRKRIQDGFLDGAQICRGAPTISRLFFADDSIIFGRAKECEILEIQRILLGIFADAPLCL